MHPTPVSLYRQALGGSFAAVLLAVLSWNAPRITDPVSGSPNGSESATISGFPALSEWRTAPSGSRWQYVARLDEVDSDASNDRHIRVRWTLWELGQRLPRGQKVTLTLRNTGISFSSECASTSEMLSIMKTDFAGAVAAVPKPAAGENAADGIAAVWMASYLSSPLSVGDDISLTAWHPCLSCPTCPAAIRYVGRARWVHVTGASVAEEPIRFRYTDLGEKRAFARDVSVTIALYAESGSRGVGDEAGSYVASGKYSDLSWNLCSQGAGFARVRQAAVSDFAGMGFRIGGCGDSFEARSAPTDIAQYFRPDPNDFIVEGYVPVTGWTTIAHGAFRRMAGRIEEADRRHDGQLASVAWRVWQEDITWSTSAGGTEQVTVDLTPTDRRVVTQLFGCENAEHAITRSALGLDLRPPPSVSTRAATQPAKLPLRDNGGSRP